VIFIDFVEGLPQSGTGNAILVVIDKFSKYEYFIPLRHPYNEQSVDKSFLDNIYKLHGFPQAIVSDRDKIFTSNLWQSLFKYAKVELRLSTAYHPQSDGQTERLNQCLETYLRYFVSTCPSKWSQWLSLAEFWYNSSFHSALGKTPFIVMYGREPRSFGLSMDSVDTPVQDVSEWLSNRVLMQESIRQHLIRAQQRMKRQADKSRSERQFNVGDWVYLKLQPYVQSSLSYRSNNKLSFKFFGPYQITARVGSVAYRLALPDITAIHPVFHVSQLKASHSTEPVTASPPSALVELQVPYCVLQRRWTEGDHPIEQVLIQWSQMPASLATWENFEQVRQQFPRAPAWGHAGSQGRAIVTNDAPATDQQADNGPEEVEARPARKRKPNPRVAGPS
jgi:hypothetical protein